MTNFNYDNMDPARREHFVYRAFDAKGQLLYVGCTMDLDRRYKEHSARKHPSRWWHLAVRFVLSGPYNYDTGRRLEREAIRSEAPIWNTDEPRRKRLYTIQRRVLDHGFKTGYTPTGVTADGYAAMDAVRDVIPMPGFDRALTDLDVQRAERAERIYMSEQVSA